MKNKPFTLVGLSLVLLVLLYGMYKVTPSILDLIDNTQSNKTTIENTSYNEDEISLAIGTQTKEAKLKESVQNIETALEINTSAKDFIIGLSNEAKQNSIEITDLVSNNIEIFKGFKREPLSLKLEGTDSNIEKTLKYIESSGSCIQIQTLKVYRPSYDEIGITELTTDNTIAEMELNLYTTIE